MTRAQRSGPSIPISRAISGQVRLANGGTPAENIIVRLDGFSGGYIGEEKTDRLGKFRFTGLAAAQYIVTVHVPGYRDVQQQVDLETNATDYLQLQLSPDKSSRGAVAPATVVNAGVPAAAQAEFDKGRTALLDEKDINGGVTHLEKAVQLYPRFYEAQLLLGTAYMDAGKWSQSESTLRRAQEINPKSGATFFALGEVYRHQKKYAEAEKVLNEGLALDDKSAQGHFTLGRVYWDKGDFVKAGPQVGKALQLKPNYAEAHLLAGNILLRARQPENALVEFEEYLRLAPNGEFAQEARQVANRIKQSLTTKGK
jgi:Tfp pilus assembly protein PilF